MSSISRVMSGRAADRVYGLSSNQPRYFAAWRL